MKILGKACNLRKRYDQTKKRPILIAIKTEDKKMEDIPKPTPVNEDQ